MALWEVKNITEARHKLFSQKLLNLSKQRDKKALKHQDKESSFTLSCIFFALIQQHTGDLV